MTKLKAQAVEILQDIPDDKVTPVIEILKALRAFYAERTACAASNEAASDAMGIFCQYANPALRPLEKEAWGEAVKEKHAVH